MRQLSPILITLCIFTGCSREFYEEYSDDVTEIFPDIFLSEELNLYVEEVGRPAVGHYTSSYQNGSIRADVTFKDGMIVEGEIFRMDGSQSVGYTVENDWVKYTLYDEKGKPKLIALYGDDLSDQREFHVWHENGTRLVESDEAIFKTWYENGRPRIQMESVDGEMHGRVASWYENGRMESEHHYSDGVKHGTFIEWDEKGKLISEQAYDMGTLVRQEKSN